MIKQKTEENKYHKIITKLHICHRIPERTFKFKGHYFPVCSRCTGIITGSLSFFFYLYCDLQYSLILLMLSIILMIPSFVDGYTQLIGLRESNNTLRFFTGFICGLGLSTFLIMFFKLLEIGI